MQTVTIDDQHAEQIRRCVNRFRAHAAAGLVDVRPHSNEGLALQEAHTGLRLLHMFTVEVWLIYFPFSRLMHAVTFLFARSHTGATYGRRGFTP